MLGFLYVFNTFCSAGQSSLSKQYARRNGNASFFNINKAAAGLILFLIIGLIQGFSFHLPTLLLSIAYGVTLCISMHTGFKALGMGPMALTSIIASFSLLIPFFFGICFWDEPLTLLGGIGIVLLLASIVLINGKKGGGISWKWLLYALTTLLSNGVGSIIQKYHQTLFPTLYRNEFTVGGLLVVVLILAITASFDKQADKKFSFSILGSIAGVLNCTSNYIVLYLSATENASVLFPIVSVAHIVAVWLSGIVFFKEKLTLIQTLGLILGIASVVLLKM